jgi:Recombination endonuclease VII
MDQLSADGEDQITISKCANPKCDRQRSTYAAHGLCSGCYHRLMRYGDSNSGGPRRVPAGLAPPGYKRCPSCANHRPFQAFSRNRRGTHGLSSECKECDRISQRARRYGITAERVRSLLSGQCAISTCHESATDIDHDHASGRVRAGLCNGHNRAIGLLRDSPDDARAIATYLEEHRLAA